MKNARTRILAILVIVSLLFLSVPAAARGVSILATVGVSASPNPYDPNSHQMLMLSWTYEDMDHDTMIEIAGPEGFAERISVPGHKGYNSWALGYPDWRDGSYSIAVIPIGYERFAGSTTLTVKKIPIPHPAPPAPSVSSNPLYYPPERVTLAVTQFGGNTPRVIGAVLVAANQSYVLTYGAYGEASQYTFDVYPNAAGEWTLEARYIFEDQVIGDASSQTTFFYVPAPPPPVITTRLPTFSGVRVVSIDGEVGQGLTPTSRVIVFLNGQQVTSTSTSGRKWTVSLTLLEGYNHIVAVAESPQGLWSSPSGPVETIYDPESKYGLAPEHAIEALGGEYSSAYMADPINTGIGNFAHTETDLTVYGRLPIAFSRYYNSLDPYFGALGNGWKHSFEYSLDLRKTGIITVARPDGRRDDYHLKSGVIEQPPGVSDRLSPRPGGGYDLLTQAGLTYVFDADGYLTTIRDEDGRNLTIGHISVAGFKRVSSVVDARGRGLTFQYDPRGRITEVRDHLGRKVSYEFSARDDLIKAHSVDGYTTTYNYNDLDQLTDIIDPDGRVVIHNVYDQKYQVVEQTDAMGRKTTFKYDRTNKTTSVTTPDGWTISDRYDDRYRLLERVDRDGKRYSFTYDQYGYRGQAVFKDDVTSTIGHNALGLVTSVTGRSGSQWSMSYDPTGHLTGVTDPAGNAWTFEYDERGRLLKYSDPTGVGLRYEHNDRGNLVYVSRASGVQAHFEFDSNDLLKTVQDDQGTLLAMSYTPLGQVETVSDARGGVTRYEYDVAGRPTAVTNALDQVTRYEYNWRSQVTKQTLQNGNVIAYEYYPDGTLSKVSDSLGRGESYTYDAAGNLGTVTDALGNTTTYERDALGQVIAVHDPSGAVTRFDYDVNGRLMAIRGPSGLLKTYDYDTAGRVRAIGNGSGGVERIGYDAAGNVVQRTDSRGLTTSLLYDAANRPLLVGFPTGANLRYEYDQAGRVSRYKDARGNWTTYEYDGRDQLITVTDALGRVTRFRRDAAGNVTGVVDPSRKVWSFGYDPLNRLNETVDPLGNRWSAAFDGLGNATEVVDPLGRKTAVEYDLGGRPKRMVDPLGQVTVWAYDLADRLRSVTDPRGAVTAYEYDSRGWLTGVTDPLGRETSYTYNENGWLGSMTGPDSQTTSYRYTAAGWLAGIDYGDGTKVDYGYDTTGTKLWMRDSSGYTTYDYDEFYRLTGVTDPAGRKVGYQYDQVGAATRLTYPDGRTVAYKYDSLGRLEAVSDWQGVAAYTYDELDRSVRLERPNLLKTAWYYDDAGRLSIVENTKPNGDLISSYLYTYDAAWQVDSVTENYTDKTTYDYDAAGRLARASRPDGSYYAYSYDPAGNIISQTRGERTKDGTFKSTESLYEVDLAGQLVLNTTLGDGQTRVTSYEYDDAGRLWATVAPRDEGEEAEEDGDNSDGSQGIGQGKAKKQGDGKEASGSADAVGQENAPDGTDVDDPEEAEYLVTEYSYDAAGRLVEIYEDGGPNKLRYVDFEYDGDGYRVGLNAYVEIPGGNGKHLGWEKASKETGAGKNVAEGRTGKDGAKGNNGRGSDGTPGGGQGNTPDHQPPGQAKKDDRAAGKAIGQGKPPKGTTGLAADRGGAKSHGKAKGHEKRKTKKNNKNKIYELNLEYVNDRVSPLSRVLATYDDKGQPRDAFVYGRERLAGYQATGQATNYLYDGQGNVRQLYDGAGKLLDRYEYSPYGLPMANGRLDPSRRINDGNTFGFAGEDHDPVFGLVYLRARYYDPAVARFTAPDPLVKSEQRLSGISPYAYASGNPISNWDPSGLITEQIRSHMAEVMKTLTPAVTEPGPPPKDIADQFNRLLQDALGEAQSKKGDLVWFFEKLRPGGEWDLKLQETYSAPSFTWNGLRLDYDAPGNILYGYIGHAIGVNIGILHFFAGVFQILGGTSEAEWWGSPFWGDDPRDYFWVDYGYQLYKEPPTLPPEPDIAPDKP